MATEFQKIDAVESKQETAQPEIVPFKWKWRYLLYVIGFFVLCIVWAGFEHERVSRKMTRHALAVGAQTRILMTIDCHGDSTHIVQEGFELYLKCGMSND